MKQRSQRKKEERMNEMTHGSQIVFQEMFGLALGLGGLPHGGNVGKVKTNK